MTYNVNSTPPTQKSYVSGQYIDGRNGTFETCHPGIDRENGLEAIEHYTQPKTIYANLGGVPQTY